MKITVTGGSGFLGSHVADTLTNMGHQVTIFDKKKSKWLKAKQKMCIGNILNPKDLKKAVKNAKVVYHFAALADINEALDEPLKTINTNILGTVNVLESCRKNKVKRFIYASSIYSISLDGGFYRCSKKAAEDYIEEYYKLFGINFTILRYGSLYGSRTNTSNGVYKILNDAIKKRRFQYIGSRDTVRKYIHVSDASIASASILSYKYKNKYVNITGIKSYKVSKLFKILSNYLKFNKKVKFLNKNYTGHYIRYPKLFRLKQGVNYKLQKSKKLEDGIMNLAESIKQKKELNV